MNDKKIVVLGGGSGQSVLLSGLKRFPLDITAVVSVCDDGKSTGKLRKEFNSEVTVDYKDMKVVETHINIVKMLIKLSGL